MDYGTDNIQLLSDHSLNTSLSDKGHDKLSRFQFIDEQHRDIEISCLFDKAVSENEVSQVPVCYFIKHLDPYEEMATMCLLTLNGLSLTTLYFPYCTVRNFLG